MKASGKAQLSTASGSVLVANHRTSISEVQGLSVRNSQLLDTTDPPNVSGILRPVSVHEHEKFKAADFDGAAETMRHMRDGKLGVSM